MVKLSNFLDFSTENGLVLCDDLNKARNNAELLYLIEAQKIGCDAVFFRRFYKESTDEKPYHSEPSVCIFQKDDSFFNSKEHIELHAKLWSAGRNEVYVIQSKTRIDIVNARKPAKVTKNQKLSLEDLKLASEALKEFNDFRFSAHLFGTGTFWDQTEMSNKLREGDTPYLFLLDHLMQVREYFTEKNNIGLASSTIDKLLVVCILIKFLEEIKDDNGKHTLRSIYKKYKIEDFAEGLSKGYCLNILAELALEFNGKIFDRFSEEEKQQIAQVDLGLVSQFLQGNVNLKTQQLFIWEQYDFKYLPAEVISAIYENFIQAEAQREHGKTEKGIVYTPIHLVNLLVDEVMPLEKPEMFKNETFKVLDPACGSGVFLVVAFKRMLQWWAINNSTKENIQYPQSKEALKILENNIFGVDVKETATLVSIFGLTTALLDKLTPQQIWNNFKFTDLNKKNITCENFFTWALKAKQSNLTFDLVIGNPPFNLETGKKKEEVLIPDIIKSLDLRHKKIPKDNLALHFFETSMALSTKTCMIIPSNVLLYNKSVPAQTYRNNIFEDYTISKIFDFTHLRRDLFHKTADTPVVAIISSNIPSQRQLIEHIVMKRVNSSEKKIRFEIDYYDIHRVRWAWAVDGTKQFVWKTNLLGGGRLFHLIYRLSLLPTIGDFIKVKKANGWKESRGFEGGDQQVLENQDQIVGIEKNAEPIIKKKVTIRSNRFKDTFMYEPPFLLMDQTFGNKHLPVCFVSSSHSLVNNRYLYYNRDFAGISVPKSDEMALKGIYDRIFEHTPTKLNYQLYVMSISSSSLVLTETDVNKSEILDCPYPENQDYLELTKSERHLQQDALNYYIHLGKAITNKGSGNVFFKNPQKEDINSYGKIFCDSLNELYATDSKSFQLIECIQSPMFTTCIFGFGKTQENNPVVFNDIPEYVKIGLIRHKTHNNGAAYERILRIYDHVEGYDLIIFVKPNAMKYWLKSIALRDADDTFVDLKKAGF